MIRNDIGGRMRKTTTAILSVAGVAGVLAWAAKDIPLAYGRRPSGERAERIRRSPQFRDGVFANAHTTHTAVRTDDDRHRMRELFFDREVRKPHGEIPVVSSTDRPASDLAITWYGHASSLVEIEGSTVLFDPIWSDRCSPSRLFGPQRLHQPPIALDQLPNIDAVVISHDHYDHLDLATIMTLVETQDAPFVVPLGVGSHLERWSVPAERIIELDWDDTTTVGGLSLTCTAAQHFSGRTMTKRNYTLWSSWVVAGAERKVFYTGDTGYFDGFARIGELYGPFDATLVQIGAYDTAWPDIHMMPEEGVAAHLDVRGDVMIPVHWGTFTLAFHPWGEPVDRAWREAKDRGVTLAVPRPGERIEIDNPPPVDPWWTEA
jgi:L-ascorbate metabolism protein UlaG (beta-lactamase superfamily)